MACGAPRQLVPDVVPEGVPLIESAARLVVTILLAGVILAAWMFWA